MLFFNLLIAQALANPNRLSSIHKDLGQAEKVYLSQGLATVIEFPKPIIEVRVGNTAVLKPSISQVSPKELTLFLSSENAGPTNLIVRADKRVYVFDIIPSKTTHQDYVKVTGGYGSPGLNTQSELISKTVLEVLPSRPRPTGAKFESIIME